MGVADLDGARVRISGVRVVKVDHPLAGTDHRAEQVLDLTALSRKVAPRPSVVDLLVHGRNVTGLPDGPHSMGLIVTRTAQPAEV